MPVYDFECPQCHLIIEKQLKIREQIPEFTCRCGYKGKLIKLVGKFNFILKGTGWYKTDYKGK